MFFESRVVILLTLFLLTDFVSSEMVDFVIVGAGTAGCAIAGRLCSALPKAKILLLERAHSRTPEEEFLVRSPRNGIQAFSSPSLTESWDSLPNPGLLGRTTQIVTGNTLGGSSSVNGMQWTVPLYGTVERWNISGLTSESAKVFFQRAYRQVGFRQQSKELRQKYGDEYIKAAEKAGFKHKFDSLDQSIREEIWNQAIAATKKGRRTDSCTAYIGHIINNECKRNLRLLQGKTVTKVLLSDEKPSRAMGIEYVSSNDVKGQNRKNVTALREVIISAGPYGSPKLLQLSGIGSSSHLRRVGIKPRVENPVGEQTQGRAINFVTSTFSGVPIEPLNNSTVLNSGATRRKWEKGEFSVLGSSTATVLGVLNTRGYISMATEGIHTLDLPLINSVCYPNPEAYGYLRIRDSNPFHFPAVFPNMLGLKKDIENLQTCMELASKIHAKFPSLFKLQQAFPAGKISKDLLRRTSGFNYHFVGGCRIGSVLTSNYAVRGTIALRVIDASVFNSMPTSAGLLASTYMIAEHASELLARKYSNLSRN